jgi:hypothetical protein
MKDFQRLIEICIERDLPIPPSDVLLRIVEAAHQATFLFYQMAVYSPDSADTDRVFASFCLWCVEGPVAS